ncbi:MAG: alkene reductase [Rhodospirillales bacterium]|nr:alkene reductase [Alphaproteobacteria bacterium]MCB9987016.1 alkene reductase [Rhodospirillales bacterium]USO08212.1 MAG: alkene reductase [Rhodospirillales bacterium]
MSSLFEPLEAGALHLKNRVVMAPLTRGRAGESRLPNALMAQYYAQRAGAGLIVSEATAISREGYGWRGAPAMYTDEQEAAWRQVTDAVHAAGGHMVLQLWHMGRLSHPDLLDGDLPLAPSAIAAAGEHRSVHKPYVTPREMGADDIARTVADFAAGARRAIGAGFDGVEIHAANGYLIDQFLRDGSNTRKDGYGGSISNRARLMLEVTQAVVDAIGAARTGIRLTPMNGVQSCDDSRLEETFVHAAEALNDFNLAYLHIREAAEASVIGPKMRRAFKNTLIVNDGYDGATAKQAVETGAADAVAFGVKFIANPDLPARLAGGTALNVPDMATFYSGGAEGYVDYPALSERAA